jgi:hypothetical protein
MLRLSLQYLHGIHCNSNFDRGLVEVEDVEGGEIAAAVIVLLLLSNTPSLVILAIINNLVFIRIHSQSFNNCLES